MIDDEYLKAEILHPFFKRSKFLRGDIANNRLRNRIIKYLTEELESIVDKDPSDDKTKVNSLKVSKNLY